MGIKAIMKLLRLKVNDVWDVHSAHQ